MTDKKAPFPNNQTGDEEGFSARPFAGGLSGGAIRDQVFEVTVRQGLAGAPWREITAKALSSCNIDPDDVEAEIQRRKALTNGSPNAPAPKMSKPFLGQEGKRPKED